jgi:hypothetical protein
MTHALKLGAIALAVGLTLSGSSLAAPTPYFSIDAASPSSFTLGLSPADILTPGPVGGPPAVFLSEGLLGLTPGDDLDALDFLAVPFIGFPHFSVDSASVGMPGPLPPDVASEAAAGQAAGDIYVSFFGFPPTNTLATNQAALGLLPAVPAGAPAAPPVDNLDALEYAPVGFIPMFGTVTFSLAAGSPTLAAIGAGPEDILLWTAPFAAPAVFLPGAALGLGAGDDLDALVDIGGAPHFSLAPGSPTLGLLGASAADILFSPAGTPAIFMPAAAMGLAPGDNMDALAAIPEPEAYIQMLAGLGLLGWMGRRRRRL